MTSPATSSTSPCQNEPTRVEITRCPSSPRMYQYCPTTNKISSPCPAMNSSCNETTKIFDNLTALEVRRWRMTENLIENYFRLSSECHYQISSTKLLKISFFILFKATAKVLKCTKKHKTNGGQKKREKESERLYVCVWSESERVKEEKSFKHPTVGHWMDIDLIRPMIVD